jgi:hypothetical protein
MALNGTQMGNEVADAVLAQTFGGQLDASEQALVRQYWQVICTAIVNHITANGHALPGTFIDSMSGAITGQGDIQ